MDERSPGQPPRRDVFQRMFQLQCGSIPNPLQTKLMKVRGNVKSMMNKELEHEEGF
jgi:hypothetical protein